MQVAEVGRAGDDPGVGVLDPREKPQQRRLADAVLTDQTGPVAGVDGEAHPRQDRAVAVGLGEVRGSEEGRRGMGHGVT
ncbi:hypothetical protein D3C74_391870 [compost metagenome]